MKRIHPQHLLCFLAIGIPLLAVLSLHIGSVPVAAQKIWQIIRLRLSGAPVPPELSGTATILFVLRLPRTIMVLLTGAALSCSGASYQGLFRNPLADPYLIGVSTGAGLGAVIAMNLDIPYTTLGLLAVPLLAFLFASLSVALVFSLGRLHWKTSTVSLILAGVAVNAFASGLTSVIMLLSDNDLRVGMAWMLGSGGQNSWYVIALVFVGVLVGILGQLRYAYPLNVLQFEEDEAASLGISVDKIRNRVIFFSTMTTAIVVAFAGVIGFVGLIVPHVIRLLIGSDYRKLLPFSAMGGAFLLLGADILARVVIAPRELPVGIITALSGAPFFLWLLNHRIREKGM